MRAELRKRNDRYFLVLEDGILYNGDLSLKNCQAIERGYDLDELFDEVDKSIACHEFDFISFKAGFQKALEILGDRKFTEEDVRCAMDRVWDWYNDEEDVECPSIKDLKNKHIQSLQQNEWEVEIVMEDVVGNLHETHHTNPTLSFPKQPIVYGERPKLDADRCIILKRVV